MSKAGYWLIAYETNARAIQTARELGTQVWRETHALNVQPFSEMMLLTFVEITCLAKGAN